MGRDDGRWWHREFQDQLNCRLPGVGLGLLLHYSVFVSVFLGRSGFHISAKCGRGGVYEKERRLRKADDWGPGRFPQR